MFQIARFTLQHIHQLQQKLCAGYGRTRLNVADMGNAYVAGVMNRHLLHYNHECLSYTRAAKPLTATVCGKGTVLQSFLALFGWKFALEIGKKCGYNNDCSPHTTESCARVCGVRTPR